MSSGGQRFLRDNAFLIAAGALPLVVVVFFILSTAIPRWTVPPPAYDLVLRMDGAYDPAAQKVLVSYQVRDGRVEAVVRPAPPNSYQAASPLFLFDHTTMNVREIPVDLPAEVSENDPPQTIVVRALSGRRVVADAKAPDGYAFEHRSRSGPGVVSEVFGMNRYDTTAALVNKGRVVPIELPVRFRFPSSAYAVGWVLEETSR
jgi:hypothetical protein